MKRKLSFVLIWILTCSLWISSAPIQAQTQYFIVINGEYIDFDVPPKNVNNRLLVPMSALYEYLGAEIEWDDATRTVTARKAEMIVLLTIGSPYASINGEIVELDAAPEISNGRTLIPIRFASESLNVEVGWDGTTNTVYLTGIIEEIEIVSEPTIVEEISIEDREDYAEFIAGRSIEAIKYKWNLAKPTYEGNPYLTAPSISSPYQTGLLHPDYLEDGLRMANFVRYLSDLPDDLILDDSLNLQAQHGAVLLTAYGKNATASQPKLTHTPTQPADMNDTFYNIGYTSTTTSNIAYYGLFSTATLEYLETSVETSYDWTLASSVRHYMFDRDDINLDHVGHRRWILNPSLNKLGFGYAHILLSDQSWPYKFEAYSAMQVFDKSRQEPVEYDYIPWPNHGYFPVELFRVSENTAKTEKNSDPWSITLNPQKYQQPNASIVSVTLTRKSDNRSWLLNQQDNQKGNDREYFNVSTQNIGVSNSIVFRPNQIESYNPGDEYTVKMTGLRTIQGVNTEIEYTVSFFSLEE